MKRISSLILGIFSSVSSHAYANCYDTLNQHATDCTKAPALEESALRAEYEQQVQEYWLNFESATEAEKESMFKNLIRMYLEAERMGIRKGLIQGMSSCAVCQADK